jgi:hypothetical protein
MGRYLKNTKINSGSYAIQLPIGTNSLGPQYPLNGQVRFNSSVNNVEVYFSGAWRGLAISGKVSIVKDTFTGDGSQTVFVLSQKYLPGREADVLSFISNIFQDPGVAYTVDINNSNEGIITFSSPPNVGMTVVVLHNFNSTQV